MSKEKFEVGLSQENGENMGMQRAEVKKELTSEQKEKLLATLKARFEKNNEKLNFRKLRSRISRGFVMEWAKVQERLEAEPEKLWSIYEMERTGGQPDVIKSQNNGKYVFVDCAPEAPKERKLCYDAKAREHAIEEAKKWGKEMPPEGNAVDLAKNMGIQILDVDEYNELLWLGDGEIDKNSVVALSYDGSEIYGSRRARDLVMVGRPWKDEEQSKRHLSDNRNYEFYFMRDYPWVSAANTSDYHPLSFRGRLDV